MARKTRNAVHGQTKKDFTLTLTPEGVEMLDARAKALGISRSELIELVARNQVSSAPERQMMGESSAS